MARVLGSPWIPGTPELPRLPIASVLRIGGVPNSSTPKTPDTLNFVGIRSLGSAGVRDSRYPQNWDHWESRECRSAGVPKPWTVLWPKFSGESNNPHNKIRPYNLHRQGHCPYQATRSRHIVLVIGWKCYMQHIQKWPEKLQQKKTWFSLIWASISSNKHQLASISTNQHLSASISINQHQSASVSIK